MRAAPMTPDDSSSSADEYSSSYSSSDLDELEMDPFLNAARAANSSDVKAADGGRNPRHFPSLESLASVSSLGESSESSDYSTDSDSDDDDDDDYLEDAEHDAMVPRLPPRRPPLGGALGGGGGGAAVEGLPFGGGGGLEGLPFTLESLKRDLEAVGRAIITSNAGEVAAERANVLASINWLASHVPNAVLDKLGKEIRESLETTDEEKNKTDESNDKLGNVVEQVSGNDDMSEVSELSHGLDADETMAMVEPTEVSNVQISYGDLATFAQTKATAFLPGVDEEGLVDDSGGFLDNNEVKANPSPLLVPKDGRALSLPRTSVVNDLSSKTYQGFSPPATPLKRGPSSSFSAETPLPSKSRGGILGIIPVKAGDMAATTLDPFLDATSPNLAGIANDLVSPRTNSASTSTTATSSKGSSKKGVKGLFRMFKKGGGGREGSSILSPGGGRKVSISSGTVSPTSSEPSSTSEDASSADCKAKMVAPLLDEAVPIESPAKRTFPFSHDVRCALLFVDISGFTKLSTLLDPESLSKAINSYFQLIVDEVFESKGDVLKFAGDACFVEYRVTDELDLEACLLSAVNGAAKIIDASKNFLVMGNGATSECSYLLTSQAAKVETLNVHCGIGAGQMVGVHVGDYESRREYLLLGEPITQATKATDHASLGEVAISPEAHTILSRVCDFTGDAGYSDGHTPTVIATREETMFRPKESKGAHHRPKIVNDISRGITSHVEGLDVDALREYRTRMALYCHPVVVDNDQIFKASKVKKADRSAAERHREEAEIRQVFTMFVSPQVEAKLSDDPRKNAAMYNILNDIMNLSTRYIDRFHGHLRQFIVDDKGLVMIITFGLRGTTIPNMVSQRALPAAIAIFSSLQMELGIGCKIGSTVGEAYCGVVGGVKRHEYAVLGPSVNLAARLMASKINPGILVDNRVRMMANRSFGFNALPPVVAKGYSEPVPIFEPLGALTGTWGRLLPNFVGRKEEILSVMKISMEMLQSLSPSRMVLVESKGGVGKSTLVAHAIEHVRRKISPNNKRLLVIRNISTESDSLVPFGVFRGILQRILSAYQKSPAANDDKSLKSSSFSACTPIQSSVTWESLSGRSIAESTQNLSIDHSMALFQRICDELNMPAPFVDYSLRELLGVDLADVGPRSSQMTPPSMKEMVDFLARAVRLCTREAKLVIIALDDIHHADEYSWKVIEQLFLAENKILFIVAMDSLSTERLKVNDKFWNDLYDRHQSEDRFVPIKLGCLTRPEITSMVMKTLGLRRKNVPEDFLDGLAIQSGGLPYFVNEVLESVKKQMRSADDFELGDTTFDSFGDLILQRLDSFDQNTRNVLNIGAVIGLSFTLDEIVGVEIRMSDGAEAAIRKLTEESLAAAVEEGILESRDMYDDDNNNDEVKYAFCHSVWRMTLLNLMLVGRKRDLHRVIAATLEEMDMETNDYIFQTKLFKHWVQSGHFIKATEIGLTVGKHFEERLGLPAQSIKMYNEALDLLRVTDEGVSKGISADVLARIDATDLTYLVRLHVALGKSLSMAQQTKESVSCYQDALRITQTARSASQLKDRSILFPVFGGLSIALKNGHIAQDAEFRYEKAMLRRYMQETRLHGDPIYIIHALTLQAGMYSRLGEFETAIDIQRSLSQMYNVEFFSMDLCDQYGSDIGAECIAASALWRLAVGEADDALDTCLFATNEILPVLERRNIHSSFVVLFPIIWVLVECGRPLEAKEAFETFVCEPFMELPQGTTTFFLRLYDPILMLLNLAGNNVIDGSILEDYVEWACDIENLKCGDLVNAKTAEMGRSADSISVEICCRLAERVKSEAERKTLVELGRAVAETDLKFVQKKGGELAIHCSECWKGNLESNDCDASSA